MAKTNSSVSSLLREDFGIEDFVAGDYSKKSGSLAFGLEDVALANQLGLLSSFKDYDTTSDTFAMEAYNLLGEANQIGIFATQGMESAMHTFSVLAQVKNEFGIEGFDPLAYGLEGFKENVDKIWRFMVAGVKKIIQSIANFIRSVMNWIGSQVAKTQVKLVEKYKNLSSYDDKKGKPIKAMIPVDNLKGKLLNFNKETGGIITVLEKNISHHKEIWASGQNASGASDTRGAGYKTDNLSVYPKELSERKIEGITLVKGKPSEIGKYVVFGKALPVEMSPAKLLSGNQWKTVLSKEFLADMKNFVSDGKRLIKEMQTLLKVIDYDQKLAASYANMTITQDKAEIEKMTAEQKKKFAEQKKNVSANTKKVRNAVKELTYYQNFSGKMTGVLYAVYGNCLKARSYYASALRAYNAETKVNDKKAKKDSEYRARVGR